MRKVLMGLAAFAMIFGTVGIMAQTAAPSITAKDGTKKDSHDRPVGGVKIKTPSAGTGGPNTGTGTPPPPTINPTPPSEGEDIPPSETPPNAPPAEDPPTYFGEPVEGSFAFLLDASGSMWGPRIATVRAETVAAISELTEDDEFDCCAYGSQYPAQNSYTVWLWQGLQAATDGNKSAATTWVNGPATNPGGGTPTYACLQACCSLYPSDLGKMFLLTDGGPNVSGSAAQILADFPGWWNNFEDCELVAICIGGNGSAISFMQALAALGGGIFISVP